MWLLADEFIKLPKSYGHPDRTLSFDTTSGGERLIAKSPRKFLTFMLIALLLLSEHKSVANLVKNSNTRKQN